MSRLTKGLALFVLVIFAAGCGVSVRGYKQVKERVDQEQAGNAGYLMGTPQQVDPAKMSKTRTVYVVEMATESPETDISDMDKVVDQTTPVATEPIENVAPSSSAMPVIPSFTSESTEATGYTEHTVEKGDTLQKISKKYYDTYKKWNKIFEANQDILKDPNRLKAGMVIKVPKE